MTTNHAVGPESSEKIRRLLADPKFELLPFKNVVDQARFLPPGALLTVTASPAKTLEDTFDAAADLLMAGFDVTPHLSARMTRDHAHLSDLLKRLEALEINRLFVVGGDAPLQGDFPDGLSILSAMEEMGHHVTDIGLPCYPEGHGTIPEQSLRTALADKASFASYMTTQMCFDGSAIVDFIERSRADGISLKVILGIPGAADRRRLIAISTRIGVGQSLRFLAKHRGLAGRFVRPGGFAPDRLIEDVVTRSDDQPSGLHIYTFNQCETTERWRQDYLASL